MKGWGSDYCTDNEPCLEHGSPKKACLQYHVPGKRVPVHCVRDCLNHSSHTPQFSQPLIWLTDLLVSCSLIPQLVTLGLPLPYSVTWLLYPGKGLRNTIFLGHIQFPVTPHPELFPPGLYQFQRAGLRLKHTQEQVSLEEEQVLLMSVN